MDFYKHHQKAIAGDIAYFERLAQKYHGLDLKLPAQDILAAVLKAARRV